MTANRTSTTAAAANCSWWFPPSGFRFFAIRSRSDVLDIHQAGTRSAKYCADNPGYSFIIKIIVLHSHHISHIHNVEMACNAMCLSRPVAARKAMAGASGTSAPQPSVHLRL